MNVANVKATNSDGRLSTRTSVTTIDSGKNKDSKLPKIDSNNHIAPTSGIHDHNDLVPLNINTSLEKCYTSSEVLKKLNTVGMVHLLMLL